MFSASDLQMTSRSARGGLRVDIKKKNLHWKHGQAEQAAQEVVEPLYLEVFKRCVDIALGDMIQ